MIQQKDEQIRELKEFIAQMSSTHDQSSGWTVVRPNKRPAQLSPNHAQSKKLAPTPSTSLTNAPPAPTVNPTSRPVSPCHPISPPRHVAQRSKSPTVPDGQASPSVNASNNPSTDPTPTNIKTPNIFVKTEKGISPMRLSAQIITRFKGEFKIASAGPNLKISTTSPKDFSALRKALENLGIPHFTFKPSWEISPKKLVLRGLPANIPCPEIEEYFKEGGVEVSVHPLKSTRPTQEPLPLYIVTVNPNLEAELRQIEGLEKFSLRFEPYRPPRGPPQCYKCQRMGHTKNYCKLPPNCVKCAGPHESGTCTKPPSESATCVNCGESHTANWRGCKARKLIMAPKPPKLVRSFTSAVAGIAENSVIPSLMSAAVPAPPLGQSQALPQRPRPDQPQPSAHTPSPPAAPMANLKEVISTFNYMQDNGLTDWLQAVINQARANPDSPLRDIMKNACDFL